MTLVQSLVAFFQALIPVLREAAPYGIGAVVEAMRKEISRLGLNAEISQEAQPGYEAYRGMSDDGLAARMRERAEKRRRDLQSS